MTATLAQVKQRLDAIEDRLDGDENEVESSADSATRPLDADLTHRVVHAAMESDRIDEDEEVAVIAAVLDR